MVAHKWWYSLSFSFLSTIKSFKNKKNNTQNGIYTVDSVGRHLLFHGVNTNKIHSLRNDILIDFFVSIFCFSLTIYFNDCLWCILIFCGMGCYSLLMSILFIGVSVQMKNSFLQKSTLQVRKMPYSKTLLEMQEGK